MGGCDLLSDCGAGLVAGVWGAVTEFARSRPGKFAPLFAGNPEGREDAPSRNVSGRVGSGRLNVEPAEPAGMSIVTLVARRGGRLIPFPDAPFPGLTEFDAAPGTVGFRVMAGNSG